MTESLDCELSGTDGLRLHDMLTDDTDMAETVEHKLLAADALARLMRLPPKKRRVWELYLGLTGEPPMTQKKVAKRVGCSRSLISRMLKEDRNNIYREVS